MDASVLPAAAEATRGRIRELLARLQEVLVRLDAPREDLETLEASRARLDALFLLVVVGEFNSGKSTLINALLGRRVLEEGVTPTTHRIQILRHPDVDPGPLPAGAREITAPHPFLAQTLLVDTPGTNALDRTHEAITGEFVPRSDLVLFATSADRPFTESERQFLAGIREWGKKLVFVVNKADILRTEEERAQVEAFVAEHARRQTGTACPVFLLSARPALEAREAGAKAIDETGVPALEAYLSEHLDDAERLKIKLASPLGVAHRLASRYRKALDERIELLTEDFQALDDVDRQLEHFREDLSREFRFRLADLDNLLNDFERRGIEFFDEHLRLVRMFELLDRDKTRRAFERKVVAELPGALDARVREMIDWMVESELRQWQGVTERLEGRRRHHADRIVGAFGRFDLDRDRLLATVGRAAHRALEGFDQETEGRRLAETVQAAVARTALVEVGAIGLGTAITVAATTQFADVTGLLAAGTLAALGFFILPARREKAKRELAERIGILRDGLVRSLTEQFDQEAEASIRRVREAIAPYDRFVRAERERLEENAARLRDLIRETEILEAEIGRGSAAGDSEPPEG